MQVDFMIIGAQKCGTSSLFGLLTRHPEVVGCRTKEPHFFSLSRDWRRDLAGYESLFETREGAIYGEASTSYTFYPLRNLRIWDDIYEYNPRMKLIYLVRNPIDRIISNYMHAYEEGFTDRSLESALVAERFYIDVSRYHTQIVPYIRRFGRDQVSIVDFDDLVGDRQGTLRRIATFLGIDPAGFDGTGDVHLNESLNSRRLHHKHGDPSLVLRVVRRLLPFVWRRIADNSARHFESRPQLDPVHRRLIVDMLELEIQALAALMDRDLSHWSSAAIAEASAPSQDVVTRSAAGAAGRRRPGGQRTS